MLCLKKHFDVIFSIAKGVQHDGRLPFWKPASVFAYYVPIIIAFAFGKINMLLGIIVIIMQCFSRCTRRADSHRCEKSATVV